MKRTATTLALLAGFGGGCVAPGTNKTAPAAQQMPQASQAPIGFGQVTKAPSIRGYQGPNGSL